MEQQQHRRGRVGGGAGGGGGGGRGGGGGGGASGAASPPPTLYFVLRSEHGAQLYSLHAGQVTPDPRFRVEKPSVVAFSSDGRLCAVAHEKGIAVADCGEETGWSIRHTLPEEDVTALYFSPRGSFLLTLARLPSARVGQPTPTPEKGNLCVWDLRSGALLAHFLHKKTALDAWPVINWSEDEEIAAKMVSNEIQFFSGNDFSHVTRRIKQEGLANFAFAPGTLPPIIAAFVPEKKGGPGQARIFKYPAIEQPVAGKTLWKAQTAKLDWAPGASGLLVAAKTDVDKSGKSYYGSTTLHFLSPNAAVDVTLSLDEEGPVHEYSWSPDGSKFVVIYGYMPARATLFDARCNKLADFGKAARNTARWSPCSRLLALGGFGNLNGQIDIWDVSKVKKVGSCQASCASSLEWSPDSAYLLAAVLSPKIRVDNGITLFRYDGSLVNRTAVDQLYQAAWRPGRLEDFPLLRIRAAKSSSSGSAMPNSNASASGSSVAASGAAKPAIYQPPSRRGLASSPVSSLRDEEEAAPKKYTQATGKPTKKVVVDLPVGFEPEIKRKPRRRNKKSAAGQANVPAEEQTEATQPEPSGNEGEQTELDAAKKAKAIEKKLRQIVALKEKQTAGATLDTDQLAKVAAEADLRKQLQKLRV